MIDITVDELDNLLFEVLNVVMVLMVAYIHFPTLYSDIQVLWRLASLGMWP